MRNKLVHRLGLAGLAVLLAFGVAFAPVNNTPTTKAADSQATSTNVVFFGALSAFADNDPAYPQNPEPPTPWDYLTDPNQVLRTLVQGGQSLEGLSCVGQPGHWNCESYPKRPVDWTHPGQGRTIHWSPIFEFPIVGPHEEPDCRARFENPANALRCYKQRPVLKEVHNITVY